MSLWSWIKNLFSGSRTKRPEPRFAATPIDLVMGVDYSISSWHDVRGQEWAKITLLTGKYKGTSFKFNKLTLTGHEADQASMLMDYDLIDFTEDKAKLESNEEFQNVVFNIAFSLLVAMNLKATDDNEDEEQEDEDSGNEIPGRNNSGKFDRE